MNIKREDIYRGLIIVYPHGTYIAYGNKDIIVKSLKLSILNKPLLLIENKQALGIIYLNKIKEINITQFDKDKNRHLITNEERKKWWPKKNMLYEYFIGKKIIFYYPIPITYPQGPQVLIKPKNIRYKQNIYIGTSGYDYKWWNYNSKNKLEEYSNNFNSLELNATFYKFYKKENFIKLRDETPNNFKFTVKVNRSITHFNQYGKINKFLSSAKYLGSKLKCLLFQFPSRFKFNKKNLNRLNKLKTKPIKLGLKNLKFYYAFEFKNKSWFNEETYSLFKKNKWCLVISNINYTHSDNLDIGFNPKLNNYVITTNFIYFRMHGSNDKYIGSYKKESKKTLYKIIEFIRESQIKNSFIYFNNTDSGYPLPDAITDAVFLNKKIGF